MFVSSMFNAVSLFENALYNFEERNIVSNLLSLGSQTTNLYGNSIIDKKLHSCIYLTNQKEKKLFDLLVSDRTYDHVSSNSNNYYFKGKNLIDFLIRHNKPVKVTSDKFNAKGKITFAKNLKKFITNIENLYGIMAYSDGSWFNLTHPLTLVDMLYGELEHEMINYLFIYEMNDPAREFHIYDKEDTDKMIKAYKEKMNIIYEFVLKAELNKMETKEQQKKEKEKEEEENIIYLSLERHNLSIMRKNEQVFINKNMCFILPVDRMAKENVVPYYAWLYGKLNHNGLYASEMISDSMLSCNIQFSNRKQKNFYQCCTGTNHWNSIQGVDAMKCANVNSPYNGSVCVRRDALPWIQANQSFCVDILNKYIADNEKEKNV